MTIRSLAGAVAVTVMMATLAACSDNADEPAARAEPQGQNWRYAHEEYEGDVQDVFAYKFKVYCNAGNVRCDIVVADFAVFVQPRILYTLENSLAVCQKQHLQTKRRTFLPRK